MTSGSTTYMEIRVRTPISLISEMIFSFFAGKTAQLILQKRYPGDTEEIDGKLYLKFTQEDTVRLYQLSGNGEVELETQVNLVNKAVVQQPKREIKVRRTRAVELVPGNAPHYEMPDTVIDIATGGVIVLKGDPGNPGDSVTVASVTESDDPGGENIVMFSDGEVLKVKNGKDGAPGKDYILTESDKVEIAEQSITSGYVTIPKSAWADDMDLYIDKYKGMRISYSGENGKGHQEYIIDQKSEGINEEWGRFVGRFIYANSDDKDFVLNFFGCRSAAAIQPYDIADIKIYLASDPDKVNILSSDIGDLGWTMDIPKEGNKFSMAFDDGLKYIHIWRQSRNYIKASANTGIKLTHGAEYIFECRMRMTCKQIYCTVPFDGMRSTSSTVVTPTKSSVAVCIDNGVRGFAQSTDEISFTASAIPEGDITVMVYAFHGKGGVIMNTHDVAYAVDAALLDTIGSGVAE